MRHHPKPDDWRELAVALEDAIDRLAAGDPHLAAGAALLLEVGPGLESVHVRPLRPDGVGVLVLLGPLPRVTDMGREDWARTPCGSIDRAASKAAAAMLVWHKDPETFELVETRRFRLHLQWPDGPATPIDEWAYGLWDE